MGPRSARLLGRCSGEGAPTAGVIYRKEGGMKITLSRSTATGFVLPINLAPRLRAAVFRKETMSFFHHARRATSSKGCYRLPIFALSSPRGFSRSANIPAISGMLRGLVCSRFQALRLSSGLKNRSHGSERYRPLLTCPLLIPRLGCSRRRLLLRLDGHHGRMLHAASMVRIIFQHLLAHVTRNRNHRMFVHVVL